MNNFAPTKSNLMKAASTLAFSQEGFNLLDKKRNVLIQEMMTMVEEAARIQDELESIFEEAYRAIGFANITMGSNSVEEMAMSIPKNEELRILSRSVMGVEIPLLRVSKEETPISFGVFRTNTAFDEALVKMRKAMELVYHLAEIENAVFRLATEIRKTAKRANSLEKIQIPKYQSMVKYIKEVLEEKEREDFFRLKKVKQKKKNL